MSVNHAGDRLDAFLASQVERLTRSRAQELIRTGHATVNGRAAKASYHLKTDDRVLLTVPPPVPSRLVPEHVDFMIVHEDASLIVLIKPAGLVVHPAPGHATGTLVHGLLDHCSDLSGIGGVLRPGIVHRLDKDTSGLMVVAKTDHVHEGLARQFKAGEIRKEYAVFVHGAMRQGEGEIDLPIGRHPKQRKRMAVLPESGKRAVTQWRVRERWGRAFCGLHVRLRTGRTHQIRVHLSHAGHPVVGDPVYGPKRTWWKQRYPHARGTVQKLLSRQMLHAERLGFTHPESGAYCEFTASLPEDMIRVAEILAAIGEENKIP
ncbi:MAG: RluA family pseudouridine synthase [Deltaproteobacteria bacterium]|nr:RluA family pseudouridine synthase [Deltaproteobacteria bacterium]